MDGLEAHSHVDSAIDATSAAGGAAVGVALATLSDPYLGAVVAPAVQEIVATFTRGIGNYFSEKEAERVNDALLAFGEEVARRESARESFRADAFVQPGDAGRSAIDELMEATLRHIAVEPQEQTNALKATMLAGFLFSPEVDRDRAHFLERLATQMSYRQFVMLPAIQLLPQASAPSGKFGDPRDDVRAELEWLSEQRILGIAQPGGGVARINEVWGNGSELADIGSFAIAPIGRTLMDLMRLEEAIPATEIGSCQKLLRGQSDAKAKT